MRRPEDFLKKYGLEKWIDRPSKNTKETDPWWWYYRFWAIYVMVIQSLIGLALIFGPERWKEFNALGLIHKYTSFIPWGIIGLVFILSGIGVLHSYTRRLSYTAAFLLTCFFTIINVLYSILSPPRRLPQDDLRLPPGVANLHPNPVSTGLALYGPLVMIAGIRFVLLNISSRGDKDG